MMGGDIHAVGDLFCNDENNNEQCDYDGGDCCIEEIQTDHCSVCECIQQ